MNRIIVLLLAVALLFVCADARAQSSLGMKVRGTITWVDDRELQVQTRDGMDLHIDITDATNFKAIVALRLSDIKRGSFVGVTAVQKAPGGPLIAREVHIFAEAQRGMGEGHYAWDLEPGASMTNANVDAIVNTRDGRELTLGYKDGTKKILVPQGVPVISFQPADRSLLYVGAQIFCIARQTADGKLTAQHISVGKNGMKPPM